jgi:hypothetical protein
MTKEDKITMKSIRVNLLWIIVLSLLIVFLFIYWLTNSTINESIFLILLFIGLIITLIYILYKIVLGYTHSISIDEDTITKSNIFGSKEIILDNIDFMEYIFYPKSAVTGQISIDPVSWYSRFYNYTGKLYYTMNDIDNSFSDSLEGVKTKFFHNFIENLSLRRDLFEIKRTEMKEFGRIVEIKYRFQRKNK